MRQDDRRSAMPRHLTGCVQCPRRGAQATINAVERRCGSRLVRSVLWCSLRGAVQWCAEDCGVPLVPPS